MISTRKYLDDFFCLYILQSEFEIPGILAVSLQIGADNNLSKMSIVNHQIQCRRCDPVGCNVTWPRITLQNTHWFLLRSCPDMPRHKCPGQDCNRNQCIICNVTKYTCIHVTILPEAYILCLGMIVTKTSV